MRKLFIVLMLLNISVATSQASEYPKSEGIAIDVAVKEKDVPDGSIISLYEGKYVLSSISYDPSVYGVVSYNPSLFFDDNSPEGTMYPVITNGIVRVRVSSVNGSIMKGDLVTSSNIKGVGMRATENGYVIGVAMEDYQEKNSKKIGQIYVTLHLNFGMLSSSIKDNLIASLKRGAMAPSLSPVNTLRYIVAGMIAILSFAFGFWFFGRVSSRGVEAIGRNPLARNFILLGVVINVSLSFLVMILGVALAYVVLVL